MIHRQLQKCIPGAVMAGAIVAISMANGGCSAVSSAENAAGTVSQAASGCDEFSGGEDSIAKLSLDGDTNAFVTASTDLVAVTTTAETDVYNACKGMAGDLKLTDTWTAMESNGNIDKAVAEACNQVALKFKAVLSANASADCTLEYAGGHCEVDAVAQASCEATCTGMTACDPGNIMTLCKPGSITGECSGMCNASATCEGSATAAAQCQGSCNGECTGMCDSTPCNGTACKGQCMGTCTADCTLAATASINCGANVNCRGGCMVAYTAPKCETTVTPPMCKVTQTCQSSCTSKVESKVTCTKPSVTLACTAMVSADLQVVVDTIKTNMPTIISLVQSQATIIVDAGKQVLTTAQNLASNLGSITGKGLACAQTAATADSNASGSLTVSVNASANVSGACGGPSSMM